MNESGAESAQSAGLPSPRLDVSPLPSGPATDRPAGLGQELPEAPDVDGLPLDAEPSGDLGDADRLAVVHAGTVARVLTDDQQRSDNHYMTKYMLLIQTKQGDVVAAGSFPTVVAARAWEDEHEADLSGEVVGCVRVITKAEALR